ncbi:MAG: formate dehydrogenase accessory sulfurtransferase FdhD [Spirochaetes bacterium]|nr:formate dehydrogenase accessory sulfurtransferase FdhD [Spirochaetota bacterium]
MLPATVTVSSHYYSASGLRPIEAQVSAEYHVKLLVNGKPFMVIVCSGSDLDLLAAGHLASEGIIASNKEIERIEVDEAGLSVNCVIAAGVDISGRYPKIRTLVSGSPGSGESSGPDMPPRRDLPAVDPRVILSSMQDFLEISTAHRTTHGVHSGALYGLDGRREAFFDEIGRHNAVDKLIGLALIRGIVLDRSMLLSTGRVSSEIVKKTARASIPVLVTRAAPTGLAIELVKKLNIVLITGVQKDGFYVANGAEQILLV